jgi:predicted DNA repair protein MutK
MPPGDDEALVLAMRVAFVRAATTDFINLNAPMRAALAVVREHDARREAGLLERAALLLKAGRYGVDDSDGKWMKWFEDRDAWLADARRRGGR